MAITTSAAFERVTAALAAGRCVVLDGGVATELPRAARGHGEDERLWGTTALIDAPADVLAVHRRYVDAGCDVISTNTWGLPSALRRDGPSPWAATRPIHWMDVARQGMRLARRAIDEGGRDGACAVAFSLNGDVDTPEGRDTVELLARLFADEPPDLILRRDALARARLPPTRRSPRCWPRGCRCGSASAAAGTACAASTASTGAARRATPSAAPRAASRSWAPARCSSTASRPTTSPASSRGCATSRISRSASTRTSATCPRRDGASRRRSAARSSPHWPRAGGRRAPSSSAAAAAWGRVTSPPRGDALEGMPAGDGRRRADAPLADRRRAPGAPRPPAGPTRAGATCSRCRSPTSCSEPGVFVPTQGSFLVWRHLFEHGSGRGRALPRRRLRHRAAHRPARPQRRHARPRPRPRRARRGEHADQRVPQRRRRSRDRRRRRPLPVGPRGALRRDRREPLPDPGRPVRAGDHPSPARLLGPQPPSTT